MTDACFELGDHLVTPRGLYTHHGLYAGDGEVIAFEGFSQPGVVGPVKVFTLDEFAAGNVITVRHYADSERICSREDSVAYARSQIGRSDYDVLDNNCEHFVTSCITGRPFSAQAVLAKVALYGIGKGIEKSIKLLKKSKKAKK